MRKFIEKITPTDQLYIYAFIKSEGNKTHAAKSLNETKGKFISVLNYILESLEDECNPNDLKYPTVFSEAINRLSLKDYGYLQTLITNKGNKTKAAKSIGKNKAQFTHILQHIIKHLDSEIEKLLKEKEGQEDKDTNNVRELFQNRVI